MAEWKCPKLKIIDILRCGIEKIGNIFLPSLEEINLAFNRVKDFDNINGWKCPNLKELDLESCNIE